MGVRNLSGFHDDAPWLNRRLCLPSETVGDGRKRAGNVPCRGMGCRGMVGRPRLFCPRAAKPRVTCGPRSGNRIENVPLLIPGSGCVYYDQSAVVTLIGECLPYASAVVGPDLPPRIRDCLGSGMTCGAGRRLTHDWDEVDLTLRAHEHETSTPGVLSD